MQNSDGFQGTAVNFYCSLKIKDKQLISSNIVSCVIREWIFDVVPRIELILNDDGVLIELFPLQDGDTISVTIGKNAKDSQPLDFSLLSFTSGSMHGTKFTQIMLVGILKVKDFYSPIRSRAFKLRNSIDVLKQIISAEGEHSLDSTGLFTNDLMTWLQVQCSNLDMVKHILKRAYKPNDCLFLYFDGLKEKFIYTSLQNELAKKEESIAKFDVEKYSAEYFEDQIDYKNLWFNAFNIFSFSTYTNSINNYGIKYNYYSPALGEKDIELRDNTHPMSDLSDKKKENVNQVTDALNFGYLSGNTFKDYYKAQAQNHYLKQNMFGDYIVELNINSLCKPRIFSKVKVNIPSVVGGGVNEPLSGEYLVAGIVHEFGVGDIYRKRVALARNGTNKSLFVSLPTVA
jgi:hypothetical protein